MQPDLFTPLWRVTTECAPLRTDIPHSWSRDFHTFSEAIKHFNKELKRHNYSSSDVVKQWKPKVIFQTALRSSSFWITLREL